MAVYVFSVELPLPVAVAVERLTQALTAEKLAVVSDVNVQGILRAKLNAEFRPYRILGVCAPGLARAIIDVDAEAGVLLPCNVVIQEQGGYTRVSFVDPVMTLGLATNTVIDDLARQARSILKRVADRLRS
jgi:uncharacterized protein (DUF302 family)